MSHEEFLATEARIFAEMKERGRKAMTESGFVAKLPQEGKEQSGYFVYITPDSGAVAAVNGISGFLKKAAPWKTINYSEDIVHSTLAAFGIIEREGNDRQFIRECHYDTLHTLSQAVLEAGHDFINKKHGRLGLLSYGVPIFDESTIILTPQGKSPKLHELVMKIQEESKSRGIELKIPKMMHITVARLRENAPAGSELAKTFTSAVTDFSPDYWDRDGPIGCSTGDVQSLNVGYFTFDKDGFQIRRYSSFGL